jgi:hypothetical protein
MREYPPKSKIEYLYILKYKDKYFAYDKINATKGHYTENVYGFITTDIEKAMQFNDIFRLLRNIKNKHFCNKETNDKVQKAIIIKITKDTTYVVKFVHKIETYHLYDEDSYTNF